ncbi:MAG: HD domain-containing protein [Candidatus Hodarchaeota archaeon]
MQCLNLEPLLKNQCGFLAKSSGELLWTHHLNTWQISKTLASYIPLLTEQEKRVLELASLTHDVGKIELIAQKVLRGERSGQCIHKLKRNVYKNLVENSALDAGFSAEEVSLAWEVLACHHFASDEDVRETSSHRIELLTQLLVDADHLSSMEQIDQTEVARIRRNRKDWLDLSFIEFSRFPSPTLDLTLEVAGRKFKKKGWKPLLCVENGIVFIGSIDSVLPDKNEIVSCVLEEHQLCSLAVRPLNIKSYTGDFLGGLSADHPELFLNAHHTDIIVALGDTRAPLYFQKLAHDILKSKNLIDSEFREKSPLMDILESANSTSSHKKAKARCVKTYGSPVPEKIDKAFLDSFFSIEPIERFLPNSSLAKTHAGKTPFELKNEELFESIPN